jgi:hypothetical protein
MNSREILYLCSAIPRNNHQTVQYTKVDGVVARRAGVRRSPSVASCMRRMARTEEVYLTLAQQS